MANKVVPSAPTESPKKTLYYQAYVEGSVTITGTSYLDVVMTRKLVWDIISEDMKLSQAMTIGVLWAIESFVRGAPRVTNEIALTFMNPPVLKKVTTYIGNTESQRSVAVSVADNYKGENHMGIFNKALRTKVNDLNVHVLVELKLTVAVDLSPLKGKAIINNYGADILDYIRAKKSN